MEGETHKLRNIRHLFHPHLYPPLEGLPSPIKGEGFLGLSDSLQGGICDKFVTAFVLVKAAAVWSLPQRITPVFLSVTISCSEYPISFMMESVCSPRAGAEARVPA